MKKLGFCLGVLMTTAYAGWSQPASSHVMVAASTLQWGEAPPALPKGAQLAVLSGDPAQTGPYVVRLRMPAGYKIPPHWHPTDEHVTVVEGTFSMGMGEKAVASSATDLTAGGYALMPAQE